MQKVEKSAKLLKYQVYWLISNYLEDLLDVLERLLARASRNLRNLIFNWEKLLIIKFKQLVMTL